jgi:hypothetical protein
MLRTSRREFSNTRLACKMSASSLFEDHGRLGHHDIVRLGGPNACRRPRQRRRTDVDRGVWNTEEKEEENMRKENRDI